MQKNRMSKDKGSGEGEGEAAEAAKPQCTFCIWLWFMCASRGSGQTELKTAGGQTHRQRRWPDGDGRTPDGGCRIKRLRHFQSPPHTHTHLVEHAGAGAAVGDAMQDGNGRF